MFKRITIIAILTGLFSCQSGPGSETEAYLREHKQWQEKRISNLTSESGWLNLAGLFWLSEGLNTVGSDKSNTIIFPGSSPPFIGSLQLEGERIFFASHEDCQVFEGDGDEAVTKIEMKADRTGNPPCAYTEFATCPLPPRENILKTRITAGEMFAGH